MLFLPVGAHQIVTVRIGLSGKQCDEFDGALAVIKGSDQRLNNADGAVVGACIAPSLKFMRLIDMPLAEFGGFVLIEAVMHAQRNFAAGHGFGKVEIGGRIVGWIAPEDD